MLKALQSLLKDDIMTKENKGGSVMSINEKITTKECVEVLLWVKVINDYCDKEFAQDAFDSKLANFLENYSEQEMGMVFETFVLGLKTMVSHKLLEYDEENRAYEITKRGEGVVDALTQAEILTDKVVQQIKIGALAIGKFVEDNLDKIEITLVKLDVRF